MQKYDVIIENDGFIVGSGQLNVLEYGEHGREGTFPRATVFQVGDVTYYVLDLELNKETIDDLESENAELAEDLDRCEDRIEDLEDEVADRDAEIRELKSQVKTLTEFNDNLNDYVEQLQAEIRELKDYMETDGR